MKEPNPRRVARLALLSYVVAAPVFAFVGAWSSKSAGGAFVAVLLGGAAWAGIPTWISKRRQEQHRAQELAWQVEQFRVGRAHQKEVERRARESRAADQAAALSGQVAAIEQTADSAVERFESLPGFIERAVIERDTAQEHFEAGAFSPFWAAIERSYSALGEYNKVIIGVRQLQAGYQDMTSNFVRVHGARQFPPFPVDLAAANAAAVGEEAAAGLDRIVYEAQRHPVFAQIWEQRRTTAVMIAGFLSLEHAVTAMTDTLRASIRSLSDAIEDSNMRLGAEISQSVSTSVASGVEQIVSSLEAQTRATESVGSRVSDATWYLHEQHMREIGLRPKLS